MVKIANCAIKIPTGTCVKHLGKCTCPPPPPLRIANFLKYHGSDRVKTDTWGGFLKEIAVASQRLSQPRLRLSQLRQNRSCPFLKTAKRFSKNDNSHRSVRYRSQPSYRNQTLHVKISW